MATSDAAREDVTDDTTVVYVKHKLFTYRAPVLDGDGEPIVVTGRRGQTRPKTRMVHVARYEAVNLDDIPEDELERGEALGAFFTEAELAALRQARSGGRAVEGTSNAEAANTGEVAEGLPELDYDDHDALVLWIKTQRPTASAVVAAAYNDSDHAEALLAAEVEATGDQPRKSVKEPLEKIIAGS